MRYKLYDCAISIFHYRLLYYVAPGVIS